MSLGEPFHVAIRQVFFSTDLRFFSQISHILAICSLKALPMYIGINKGISGGSYRTDPVPKMLPEL